MLYSCGVARENLWVDWGHTGLLSIVVSAVRLYHLCAGYIVHSVRWSIHIITHTWFTPVARWVFHGFHMTYNYNNIYKENCV
jgi:hypothetical protein